MTTTKVRGFLIAGAVVTALVSGAGPATAQQGHDAGVHQGARQSGGPHKTVQQWMDDFDRVIAGGRGAGLAFAADQNGYPGPMHVLELADELALSPEQQAKMRALVEAMFAESKPKSARLLDAERRLRAVFAEGRANETAIRTAVGEVERARSEVRLIHLLTHLKTRDLLTEEQRRLYHEARWGQ